MPLFEFECEACGLLFEEIADAGADALPCPACASSKTHRLLSAPSPLKTGAFPFRAAAPRQTMPGRACGGACAMNQGPCQKG